MVDDPKNDPTDQSSTDDWDGGETDQNEPQDSKHRDPGGQHPPADPGRQADRQPQGQHDQQPRRQRGDQPREHQAQQPPRQQDRAPPGDRGRQARQPEAQQPRGHQGQQPRQQDGQQPPQSQGQQPREHHDQQPRRNQRGQPQQRGQQGRQQQGEPRRQRAQGGAGRRQGHAARQRQGGLDLDLSGLPWVSGAITGVAYFVTALIATGLVVVLDVLMIASGTPTGGTGTGGGSGEALVYFIAWAFYGAHFVGVSLGMLGGSVIDLLGLAGLPSVVYYALPPVFLFLAGRSVARSNGTADMDNTRLAMFGATIVAGYLPLAVVGKMVFTQQGIGPDMLTTVLLMGLVFPLLFGGIGGYLSTR